MSFMINVSPETLDKIESGSILGHIWVQIDKFSFPSRAWDDFPVVIMGWWLENVAALWSGAKTKCECLFMDGPFYFEIIVQKEDKYLLQFFRRGWQRQEGECLFEGYINRRTVVAEMLSAANLVIRTCHEKSWHSGDLDILEAHYSDLRKRVISND